MREMGTVELLTREGEIRIAKRIEEGLDAVRSALAIYPATYEFLMKAYEPVKAGQAPPGRHHRRLRRSERAGRDRPAAEPEAGLALEEPTEDERGRRRRRRRARRKPSTPAPIRKRRRAASLSIAKLHAQVSGPREARREGPEDAEAAQEARRRVHGAQARAAHVRRADPESARPRLRDPPPREGDHGHRRAAMPACRARTSSLPSRRTRPTRAGSEAHQAQARSTPRR